MNRKGRKERKGAQIKLLLEGISTLDPLTPVVVTGTPARECSAIIPILASNSPFFRFLGVLPLKQSAVAIVLLIAAGAGLVSCSSNYSGTSTTVNPASVKVHVFVSNPLSPTTTSTSAVLDVVDGQLDLLSNAISVDAITLNPGALVLFPNKRFTLVLSSTGNTIGLVNNSTQSVVQTSGGTPASIALPAPAGSVVVGPDNATGFVAVPTANVTGQSPGVVDVLNFNSSVVTASIPVPGATFLAQSRDGNRLVVLGGSSNTITVLTASALGTSGDPRTVVCPDGSPQPNASLCPTNVPNPVFDHPVWAVFSADGSTAYILNCGAECGGTSASVTVLDINSDLASSPIPVDAATVGLLAGNTLYVAGTKPGATCTASQPATLATTCGEVSVVNLASGTVSSTATITDGTHSKMVMGSNNQLFIGAQTCTNINAASSGGNPGEVRGCLSIFDTAKSTVVVPPATGDVTGIEPISRRNVVYVVQNGQLGIYDTTTDKLQTTQVSIVGQLVDVLQVD